VVDAVRDGLAERDPEHAAQYRQRADRYRSELEAVDEEIRQRIAEIPAQRRVLVTSHDAFRYFGRAYGMDGVGIQGISTADEATTGDIDRVAATVADRGVRSVFVESSVSRQTLDAVIAAARSRGSPITVGGELFSDAAGSTGTAEGTYIGMLRANTDKIVTGVAMSGGVVMSGGVAIDGPDRPSALSIRGMDVATSTTRWEQQSAALGW